MGTLYLQHQETSNKLSPSLFKNDLINLIKNRKLAVINLSSISFNIGQASFYTYLTLFLRDAAFATQPVAAACLALSQIATASGRVGYAYISDTLFSGRRKPIIVMVVLVAIMLWLFDMFLGWGVSKLLA